MNAATMKHSPSKTDCLLSLSLVFHITSSSFALAACVRSSGSKQGGQNTVENYSIWRIFHFKASESACHGGCVIRTTIMYYTT